MIEARGIGKRFGRRIVLKSLDLKLEDGIIVVLMGPNGAGKTTLLRIMATLSRPTSGQILIDGEDAFDDAVVSRKKIGVLGHSSYTYDDLTPLENLRFFGSMFSLPKEQIESKAMNLIEKVGLTHRMNDRAGIFSKGMRQRLAIARTLIHSPKILLLDEPFSSLDQKGVDILSNLLLDERKAGCSILLITHDLQRIARLADEAHVLVGGRIDHAFGEEAIKSGELESYYASSVQGGIL